MPFNAHSVHRGWPRSSLHNILSNWKLFYFWTFEE